jgi:VWFA-related protein
MTWRSTLAASLFLAGAVAPPQPTQQRPPAFRTSVRTVAIYATVQDRDGRLVPDLERSDFLILGDGKPVEITVFSNETVPITVAVMLDMSNSVAPEFARVRDAAQHFVDALHPGDRARIGTFGEEVAVSPHLTGDQTLLRRVLREELWPGGGTPLWTALSAGMASLAQARGRRVVLALSDGRDACSVMVVTVVQGPFGARRTERGGSACLPFEAIRDRAFADEFMIYAIGMEGPGLDRQLKTLAIETGGGAFQLRRNADLAATFGRVVEELHHQYTIGFVPVAFDGRTHALDVRALRPGLTVRARRSYVASEHPR